MKYWHLNKRNSASLSRKTTTHGSRGTIHGGKRQIAIKLPASLWSASPDKSSFPSSSVPRRDGGTGVKTTGDGSPDRQNAFPYFGKGAQLKYSLTCTLGAGYWLAGEDEKARQTLEEGLEIAERCKARYYIGWSHRFLGDERHNI